MTLYEIHSALARSLGDPFKETTAHTIYDGVRYSKAVRSNYLYRAADSVINGIIAQLAQAPRDIGSEVIMNMLPHMVSHTRFDINSSAPNYYNMYDPLSTSTGERVAYILAVSAHYDGVFQQLPIVSPLKGQRLVSQSLVSTQMNDPITWISESKTSEPYPNGYLSVYLNQGNQDLTGKKLQVEFIRYPYIADVDTEQDTEFDFERSYLNVIIAKATLYGKLDGGDMPTEQVLPLILQ
jgi:hypothetical protein